MEHFEAALWQHFFEADKHWKHRVQVDLDCGGSDTRGNHPPSFPATGSHGQQALGFGRR